MTFLSTMQTGAGLLIGMVPGLLESIIKSNGSLDKVFANLTRGLIRFVTCVAFR